VVHPRIAVASGFAALAAAVLILTGRIDAPIPFVVALLLAARATSPAAVAGGARALSRLASSVPAWTGIALVGILRAGSASLADARGANAVAGLALFRGPALTVAACWVAAVAVVVACASCAPSPALRELDLISLGAQLALAVTLFAGPQVRRASDALPWLGALVVVAAAVAGARALAAWEWAPKAATLCAALAVGLAFAAPKL
jgi:hypothetical protein